MHGGVKEPRIAVEALDVPRSVIPIDAEGVNWRASVFCIRMQKLHDAAEVVRLAWWFADKVHVICSLLSAFYYTNLSLLARAISGKRDAILVRTSTRLSRHPAIACERRD